MRVIEEKIISSLKNIQMDVEQGCAVDSYTVLSRSDCYLKGEPRDIILYEDNCIKYKLFNTTLYCYRFETGLHQVLCSACSQTTMSRVKALLTMDPAITDIHIKMEHTALQRITTGQRRLLTEEFTNGRTVQN